MVNFNYDNNDNKIKVVKKKIKYSNKLRGCWAWKRGYELQFLAHVQLACLTFHSHMRWLTLVHGGPSAWFIGSWLAATWQLGSGGIWWTTLGPLHLNTWKAKPNNVLGDLGFEPRSQGTNQLARYQLSQDVNLLVE